MGSAPELSLKSENERLRTLVAELEGRLGARGEECGSNRQQSADELWQRHEAFQTLAENSTDAIDRVDRENRHLYVNAAFAKMMALSPEAIIGRTNRELGVPDPFARIWEERARSVFESGRTLEIEDSLPTSERSSIVRGAVDCRAWA